MSITIQEHVTQYMQAGLSPIPLKPRSKVPKHEAWTDLRLTPDDIATYFTRNCNIGILTGEPSKGLVDVDLDCLEATQLAPLFLPTTRTFGRQSAPRSHWLYMSEGCTTRKYEFEKQMLLELRATGCQTMVPPSIHDKTGETVRYENDLPIKGIAASDLRIRVNELAAAVLLSRAWQGAHKVRHTAALALAGGLRTAGWPEEKAKNFVNAVITAGRDEEAHDRITAVKTTYAAKDDDKITGWPTLAESLGDAVVDKAREWLEITIENVELVAADLKILRLSDAARKPIRWLWPGRIPLGKVTIIQGDPGVGKTMVALVLAAHVTTGRNWPVEDTECPLGDVLCISGEDDPEDTIGPRMDALGGDSSRFYLIQSAIATNKKGEPVDRAIALDQDVRLVEAELRRHPECRLLIIDPIGEYLGQIDAHNNAQVRALIAPWRELAAKYQVALVLVNHWTKDRAGSAITRGIGSMAFIAAARTAYQVSKDPRDPTGEQRLMLPVKCNFAPTMTGFAFQVKEDQDGQPIIIWSPEVVTMSADEALKSKAQTEEDSAQAQAEEFLRDLLADGPVTKKEVEDAADACSHAWRTIRRAQTALKIKPKKVHKAWMWALPDYDWKEDGHADQEDGHTGQVGHLHSETRIKEEQVIDSIEDGQMGNLMDNLMDNSPSDEAVNEDKKEVVQEDGQMAKLAKMGNIKEDGQEDDHMDNINNNNTTSHSRAKKESSCPRGQGRPPSSKKHTPRKATKDPALHPEQVEYIAGMQWGRQAPYETVQRVGELAEAAKGETDWAIPAVREFRWTLVEVLDATNSYLGYLPDDKRAVAFRRGVLDGWLQRKFEHDAIGENGSRNQSDGFVEGAL